MWPKRRRMRVPPLSPSWPFANSIVPRHSLPPRPPTTFTTRPRSKPTSSLKKTLRSIWSSPPSPSPYTRNERLSTISSGIQIPSSSLIPASRPCVRVSFNGYGEVSRCFITVLSCETSTRRSTTPTTKGITSNTSSVSVVPSTKTRKYGMRQERLGERPFGRPMEQGPTTKRGRPACQSFLPLSSPPFPSFPSSLPSPPLPSLLLPNRLPNRLCPPPSRSSVSPFRTCGLASIRTVIS